MSAQLRPRRQGKLGALRLSASKQPKDEDETSPAPAPAPSLAAAASGLLRELTSSSPATGPLVETAAAQVVRRIVNTPPPPPSSSNRYPRHPPSNVSAPSPASPPLFRLESTNFLDKSLEAITGVGRFVEGFAVTLDSVIGQAIEDWGTPTRAKAHQSGEAEVDSFYNNNNQQQHRRGEDTSPPSLKELVSDGWGNVDVDSGGWADFGIDDDHENQEDNNTVIHQKQSSSKTTTSYMNNRKSTSHTITPFMSRLDSVSTDDDDGRKKSRRTSSNGDREINEWERKALAMQAELEQLKKQQEDYKRLKEEHDSIKAQLAHVAGSNEDSLETAQLTAQMEALLVEKARLAQENDRLAREKAGLQELLEFTVAHQAQELGDDELFGEEVSEEEEELDVEEAFSSKLQLE